MHHLTFNRRIATALFLGAYVVSTTGCTGWHNQQGSVATIVAPPPKASADAAPPSAGVPGLAQDQPVHNPKAEGVQEIRVTTTTRGTLELRYPRVTNDSLYGLVGKSGTEVGFPVREVTSVETKGSNAGGTILLVGGVAALTFGVLVAATAAGMCDFGC